MGLDPPTLTTLTHLLKTFTLTSSPRLVLALRPQDPLPEWITHIIYLGPSLRVAFQGLKDVVLQDVKNLALTKTAGSPNTAVFFSDTSCQKLGSLLINQEVGEGASQTSRGKEKLKADKEHTDSILTYAMQASPGEPLVEMEGVRVAYGQKQILGDWEQNIDGHLRSGLWWTIRRGERWGMFGPNGIDLISAVLHSLYTNHIQGLARLRYYPWFAQTILRHTHFRLRSLAELAFLDLANPVYLFLIFKLALDIPRLRFTHFSHATSLYAMHWKVPGQILS